MAGESIGSTEASDIQLDIESNLSKFQDLEKDCQHLFVKFKRFSCFIHRLQIVVKRFEKDASLTPLMKKAKKIVSAFRHSVTCTSELNTACNKSLIAHVSTRWNSTPLMLRILLDVQEYVSIIITKHLKSQLSHLWNGLSGVSLWSYWANLSWYVCSLEDWVLRVKGIGSAKTWRSLLVWLIGLDCHLSCSNWTTPGAFDHVVQLLIRSGPGSSAAVHWKDRYHLFKCRL